MLSLPASSTFLAATGLALIHLYGGWVYAALLRAL